MFTFLDDDITKFVKEHSMAVIATISPDGRPFTSTIFYVYSRKDKIYFVTKTETSKYKNLKSNGVSSITINDYDRPVAVNMSGSVVEVTSTAERDEVMKQIFSLSYGHLHDFAPIIKLHRGSFSVMKFTPEEAKLSDYTNPIGKVQEDLKNY